LKYLLLWSLSNFKDSSVIGIDWTAGSIGRRGGGVVQGGTSPAVLLGWEVVVVLFAWIRRTELVGKGGCDKRGTIPYSSIGSGDSTLGPETLSILGRVACRQLFFWVVSDPLYGTTCSGLEHYLIL
jgi:hypothetical protein